MNKPDSPSIPTQAPTAAQGNILLYLPWEFDMLGGVDVVVDRLWKGLEKTIPGRSLIGIQDWVFQGKTTDKEGRRFLHLNLPQPPDSSGIAKWRYLLTLVRRLPILLRTLKAQQINAINAHYPTRNLYALAILKQFGLWRGRLVLSFHGSDVNEIDPASPHWRLIAQHTEAVTACSVALAKRVANLNLFKQPTQVIYNGIDYQHFARLAESTPPLTEAHSPYILNVGNYVPHKGQDVLLKAFKSIAPKYKDLSLVYVGGANNGIWLERLKALAIKLKIESRVVFLTDQPQSSVAALMRNAACLVHTSHHESFGLVLIEAGACATPIVATRVGGIPEIVSSDNFGLLATPGNDEEIAGHICRILEAPDLAKNNARNFLMEVQRKFSTEAMTIGYKNIILKPTQ